MSNDEDIIYFKELPEEGQSFISGSGPYSIDDRETESEIDNMMGGPMTAVETLLEGTYYNADLYACITCDYDNIKNTLAKEAFDEMKQTMLTNAYQYSLAVGVMNDGFKAEPKVYYRNHM